MRPPAPLGMFLRRSPSLAAIHTAIAETVASGTGLASITPKSKRVIRTEPVQMTDGRIHGVHVWCGPTADVPSERPIPGPLKWDFTDGDGSASNEYLANTGVDPAQDSPNDRDSRTVLIVDDCSPRETPQSWVANITAGLTYCATWEFADQLSSLRRVGWWIRTLTEPGEDGRDHVVARGMNLVEAIGKFPNQAPIPSDHQPDEYQVVVDAKTWRVLSWASDPRPGINRQPTAQSNPASSEQLSDNPGGDAPPVAVSGTLRALNDTGDEVGLHVSLNEVKLPGGDIGGLVRLRRTAGSDPADVRGTGTSRSTD